MDGTIESALDRLDLWGRVRIEQPAPQFSTPDSFFFSKLLTPAGAVGGVRLTRVELVERCIKLLGPGDLVQDEEGIWYWKCGCPDMKPNYCQPGAVNKRTSHQSHAWAKEQYEKLEKLQGRQRESLLSLYTKHQLGELAHWLCMKVRGKTISQRRAYILKVIRAQEEKAARQFI